MRARTGDEIWAIMVDAEGVRRLKQAGWGLVMLFPGKSSGTWGEAVKGLRVEFIGAR